MKIRHPKLPKFVGTISRHPKRWIVITLTLILLAGIIIFGVLSYIHWHNQSQHADQASVNLKSLIDNSLGKDSKTLASDQIAKIIKDFDNSYGDNPCSSPSQFQWQTIIPAVQDIQHSCDTSFSASLDVIKSLQQLLTFIHLEQSSAVSIKTTVAAAAKSTSYTTSAKAWSDLAEDFSSTADTDFQPVTDKIKSVATTIATSYTTLSSALSSESKAELDEAISDLQNSYKTLATINTVALAERTILIDSFIDSYQKL